MSLLAISFLAFMSAHAEEKVCTANMQESCSVSSAWGTLGSIQGQDQMHKRMTTLAEELTKDVYDGHEVESFKKDVAGKVWLLVSSYGSDSHKGFSFSQFIPENNDGEIVANSTVLSYAQDYMKEKCEKFDVDFSKIDEQYYHTYLNIFGHYSKMYRNLCDTLKGGAGDYTRRSSGIPILVTWPSTNKKVLVSRTVGNRSFGFTCSVSLQDIGDKRLCRFLDSSNL